MYPKNDEEYHRGEDAHRLLALGTAKRASPYAQLHGPHKSLGGPYPQLERPHRSDDFVSPTRGVTPKRGSPYAQLEGPHKSIRVYPLTRCAMRCRNARFGVQRSGRLSRVSCSSLCHQLMWSSLTRRPLSADKHGSGVMYNTVLWMHADNLPSSVLLHSTAQSCQSTHFYLVRPHK